MNCVDVLRRIIHLLSLQSGRFTLFEHFVGVNWRVRYSTTSERLKCIEEGIIQHAPLQEWTVTGEQILAPQFEPASYPKSDENVVSVSSLVLDRSGRGMHLAMMNLHPDEGLGYDDIVRIAETVTNRMPGYLLDSGRYYHFYGVALLETIEWIRFMAQFLMPTIIVSPRYIGHCMYRGYAALRLSTDKRHKTLLPKLRGLVGDQGPGMI